MNEQQKKMIQVLRYTDLSFQHVYMERTLNTVKLSSEYQLVDSDLLTENQNLSEECVICIFITIFLGCFCDEKASN